jgi:hypothetical protein
MERYVVPRNIKVREVVAHGLNGKQLAYILIGAGGSFVLWSAGIPFFGIAEKLAGTVVCMGAGLSLSLAKVNGQELDKYAYNTARYPFRAKEFEGGEADVSTKKAVVCNVRFNL